MPAQVTLLAITPNAEDLVEQACRVCYQSYHRYNPPQSTIELLQKVLKKGHHSVFEHASATFKLTGVSRVLTHELVRHRFISPSQESQRYVAYADTPSRPKTKDYDYVVPPTVKQLGVILRTIGLEGQVNERETFESKFRKTVQQCYELYQEFLDYGVPPEDARYILPNATTTDIVITANFRELRHFFFVRTNERASWEIRGVALQMLKMMLEQAPNSFFDFAIDEQHQCATCEYPS